MDSRLLDVLHHAAHQGHLPVPDRVDVDLDRVLEELVNQDRVIRRRLDRLGHVLHQRSLVVADLHRPPAQHVAGSDQDRVPDPLGHGASLLDVGRNPVFRLPQVDLAQDRLELLAVLGRIDHVRRRADDRHPRCLQPSGQVQWRLATELHDHSVGVQPIADIEHVLGRQWLEEQQVRGVVVGRNGFGIRVHHDALDPQLA